MKDSRRNIYRSACKVYESLILWS